jgi:hypothetical protein
VHERDEAMRRDLERRGYALEESTRGDGHGARRRPPAQAEIELGPPDWFEYLRILGVPPGLLSGADHAAFHVLVRTPWWRERRGRDGVRPRRPD